MVDTSIMRFSPARAATSAPPVRVRDGGRLLALEALRGAAAIVVAIHHFLIGFAPGVAGYAAQFDFPRWLVHTPLNVFINGPSAVIVFFVLSGFVLTHRQFEAPEPRRVLQSVVKRWPRLLGPVVLAVMLSLGCFVLGLYAFEPAGRLVRSPDLFAFFRASDGMLGRAVTEGSLSDALAEATYRTFIFGESTYDAPLWTMRVELFGSMLVFLIAGLMSHRTLWILGLVVVLLMLPTYYGSFVLGTVLAYLHVRLRFGLGKLATLGLAVGGLYFLGAPRFVGVWSWLDGSDPTRVRVLGAGLLLLAVTRSEWVNTVCSGPVSEWLGRSSFALYLLHVPILASASAWAYLASASAGLSEVPRVLMAAVAFVLVAVPLVWMFARFDVWWVGAVNRAVERVLPARAAREV